MRKMLGIGRKENIIPKAEMRELLKHLVNEASSDDDETASDDDESDDEQKENDDPNDSVAIIEDSLVIL
jgi:hypothetical protein